MCVLSFSSFDDLGGKGEEMLERNLASQLKIHQCKVRRIATGGEKELKHKDIE